jgi:DNA-binding MarR family transcriptional regulator
MPSTTESSSRDTGTTAHPHEASRQAAAQADRLGLPGRPQRPLDKTSARSIAGLPDAVDTVNMDYLQGLLGYNARRAALAIIEVFLQRMAPYGLRPVDFSVLSVIHHNPGITSRQLCAALSLLPPNLVGLVQALQARGLIEKKPHPRDGRAFGLHPTAQGLALIGQAEATALALEAERAHRLSPGEHQTLLTLLQKIYL